MSKGGSGKGFPFERKIAKRLSLWWTNGENSDVFWRTAGSGGRATNRKKLTGDALKYSYGDIGLLDPIGKPFIDYFLMELKKGYSKKGKKIDPLACIDSKQSKTLLEEWWEKATQECDEAGRKQTLIIFERDHMYSCVMVSGAFLCDAKKQCGIYEENKLIINIGEEEIVITRLGSFLNWLDLKLF